jgi:hypothetical protein
MEGDGWRDGDGRDVAVVPLLLKTLLSLPFFDYCNIYESTIIFDYINASGVSSSFSRRNCI